MDDRMVGGPIGRLFDVRVGDGMVATQGGDVARLKALAEQQAGPQPGLMQDPPLARRRPPGHP